MTELRLGVGIIGCGLIGQKRSKSLGTARLTACADLMAERAAAVAANQPDVLAFSDWRRVLECDDVKIVIVATPNHLLAEIAEAAIKAGKHLLVEKPAARNALELEPLMRATRNSAVKVRVGFNHRYHPALQKARELYSAGSLGEMMFVRGRYGHGGRRGYENEWRADPELSGGGELIDQGVHLIDLARWFLGDFSEVSGLAHTYFWPMPVDDNAFMLLTTPAKKSAFLHVSCTEWKNLFSLEIYGHKAKLHVEGLGGSYGVERLSYYRMLPQMGPPETIIWEYPMADTSWQTEFAEFVEDIRLGREPSATLEDAYAVLTVVDSLYAKSGCDYGRMAVP